MAAANRYDIRRGVLPGRDPMWEKFQAFNHNPETAEAMTWATKAKRHFSTYGPDGKSFGAGLLMSDQRQHYIGLEDVRPNNRLDIATAVAVGASPNCDPTRAVQVREIMTQLAGFFYQNVWLRVEGSEITPVPFRCLCMIVTAGGKVYPASCGNTTVLMNALLGRGNPNRGAQERSLVGAGAPAMANNTGALYELMEIADSTTYGGYTAAPKQTQSHPLFESDEDFMLVQIGEESYNESVTNHSNEFYINQFTLADMLVYLTHNREHQVLRVGNFMQVIGRRVAQDSVGGAHPAMLAEADEDPHTYSIPGQAITGDDHQDYW